MEYKCECELCHERLSFDENLLDEMITCPHCLRQTRLLPARVPVSAPKRNEEDIGWEQFMILCGLGGMIYFEAFFEIGKGDVANLDLLNQRLCGVICSSTVSLLGVLLIISYRIGRLSRQSQ